MSPHNSPGGQVEAPNIAQDAPALAATALTMRAEVVGLDFKGRGRVVGDGGQRLGSLPKVIPGDVLSADVAQEEGRARARGWRLLAPSPDRLPDPGCAQDARCPGCQWRSMRLDAQRAHRQQAWHLALERLSGLSLSSSLWRPPVPSPVEDGYRVRAVARWLLAPSGERCLGMVSLRALPDGAAQPPIDLAACPAQTPRARRVLSLCAAALTRAGVLPYDADDPSTLTGLYLLAVDAPLLDGPARVLFTSPTRALPDPIRAAAAEVAAADPTLGVWFGGISLRDPTLPTRDLLHLGGPERLVLPSALLASLRPDAPPLGASPGAWTPTSPLHADGVARALLGALSEVPGDDLAGPDSALLELGCGVGTHALPLLLQRPAIPAFIGVDASRPAILDAQRNAEALGLSPPRVTFRVGFADHAARRLLAARTRTPRAILHGMRLPFGPALAPLLPPLGVARLWYLSPSAFALGEDLKHLSAAGYTLTALTALDTMPHTYHMMALAVLERAVTRP